DQLGGVFDVGKQHRDLLALAFQGRSSRQNFLSQVRGGVGKRGTLLRPQGYRGKGQRQRRVSEPDQDSPLLIRCQSLGIDEFFLEVFQVVIVQVKPPLERPVREPLLALEQLAYLGEEFVKRHVQPSRARDAGMSRSLSL